MSHLPSTPGHCTPAKPQLANPSVPLTFAETGYEYQGVTEVPLPHIGSLADAIDIVERSADIISVFTGNYNDTGFQSQMLVALADHYGDAAGGDFCDELIERVNRDFDHNQMVQKGPYNATLHYVSSAVSLELAFRWSLGVSATVWPREHIPSPHVIAAYLKVYNSEGEDLYEDLMAHLKSTAPTHDNTLRVNT